jgi:hypothetical protein
LYHQQDQAEYRRKLQKEGPLKKAIAKAAPASPGWFFFSRVIAQVMPPMAKIPPWTARENKRKVGSNASAKLKIKAAFSPILSFHSHGKSTRDAPIRLA